MRRSRPAALLVPLILASLVCVSAPRPAPAQPTGSPADTPEEAVRGIFDAMRAADSAAARRYLHPETRLHRPVEKDGETVLQVTPVQGWLDAIDGAEPGQLDEKIWDVEVNRDGRLATAWMRYAFYVDGEMHHCGVNAFQLIRRDGGWQVFGVSDTSRGEGCEGPPSGG